MAFCKYCGGDHSKGKRMKRYTSPIYTFDAIYSEKSIKKVLISNLDFNGFSIMKDEKNIDLFVEKNNKTYSFEIKSVNDDIRKGIGQALANLLYTNYSYLVLYKGVFDTRKTYFSFCLEFLPIGIYVYDNKLNFEEIFKPKENNKIPYDLLKIVDKRKIRVPKLIFASLYKENIYSLNNNSLQCENCPKPSITSSHIVGKRLCFECFNKL